MDVDLGELESKARSWGMIVGCLVLFLVGFGAGWFAHIAN